MRKLIVSMNVTLDGFMAGPDCELDWHFGSWNREMAESLSEQLSKADTILLGRVTYTAMAEYWPYKANDSSLPAEDLLFAKMMNSYHKVVVSKTLSALPWNNSTQIKGNLKQAIAQLKEQPGRDIIIYGSGILVAALMQLNFIDEYILWVHPVILAGGKPLFKRSKDKHKLQLRSARTFSSGVVILDYDCE